MNTNSRPSYDPRMNRLAREEKVKASQVYKRKNQQHPAFGKR